MSTESEPLSDDDWADLEDHWVESVDDDLGLLTAADANIDAVSRMMSAMRRLNAEIAEYDRLDAAERRRLDTARDRAIGPLVRRVEFLAGIVQDYAVRAFLDFGKTRLATPNGTITSNPTQPALVVDDDVAGQFFETTERVDLVAWKPKVPVKDLRTWLETAEANGELVRCIVTTTDDGVEELDLPPGHVYRFPFTDAETGRWRIPGGGQEPTPDVAHEVVGAGPDRYLPGVTWSPSGTGASGRNFHIKPA
jgi:hypothetical protein